MRMASARRWARSILATLYLYITSRAVSTAMTSLASNFRWSWELKPRTQRWSRPKDFNRRAKIDSYSKCPLHSERLPGAAAAEAVRG